MKEWFKVTLILCAFGTLREIRPSEPFVSEFLTGEWRDVTSDQLLRFVYPVGTYSYAILLVVIFLITDFLRFKPVIIISGISGISIYAILLWTESIEWLLVSQVLYGIYMATEIAYYTYIYAKVDPAKYPRVSSYTRAAALVGRFLSGLSGQLLVFFKLMDYRELNYITLTAQFLATIWAFWLPPVLVGIYFHRGMSRNVQQDSQSPIVKEPPKNKQTFRENVSEASRLIVQHARGAFTRPKVLVWSALYAVEIALFSHVQYYMQILWQYKSNQNGLTGDYIVYNGAVEAIQTLLGVAGAFMTTYWSRPSLPALAAGLQGVALFLGTYVPNLYVSYAGYIVLGMLYHFVITLASAKIAGQLSDDSCFGLIFGINTFIGVVLQSLLTVILNQLLMLSTTSLYFVLSGFFLILATFWLLGWIINSCKQKEIIINNN